MQNKIQIEIQTDELNRIRKTEENDQIAVLYITKLLSQRLMAFRIFIRICNNQFLRALASVSILVKWLIFLLKFFLIVFLYKKDLNGPQFPLPWPLTLFTFFLFYYLFPTPPLFFCFLIFLFFTFFLLSQVFFLLLSSQLCNSKENIELWQKKRVICAP